jgi:hypothetical protein
MQPLIKLEAVPPTQHKVMIIRRALAKADMAKVLLCILAGVTGAQRLNLLMHVNYAKNSNKYSGRLY